jgi:hypothetical protein
MPQKPLFLLTGKLRLFFSDAEIPLKRDRLRSA